MAAGIAIYVSKRLQRPAAAILCLILAQLLVSLSDCGSVEHIPMLARAPISAR